MTEQKTTSLSQKQSSLVINGIHLHSEVDPYKEAEIFCNKYEKEIFSNDVHIILGLGVGYHLNELIKRLYKAEKKINILVIEPNKDMIANYQDDYSQFAEIPGIQFYSDKPDELYENESFINVLYKKPAILIHQNSYEANKEYFYSFLTYKASDNLADFRKNIDPELSLALKSFNSSTVWNQEDIEMMTKRPSYQFESVFWSLFKKI